MCWHYLKYFTCSNSFNHLVNSEVGTVDIISNLGKWDIERLNNLSTVSQLVRDKDWVPGRLVLELVLLTINNATQSLDECKELQV